MVRVCATHIEFASAHSLNQLGDYEGNLIRSSCKYVNDWDESNYQSGLDHLRRNFKIAGSLLVRIL